MDHSVLIHIYDGSFFHKERPPLQTFEIPLPIRLCSLVKYIYKQGFAQWLPVKVGMVLFSASKELFWYLNPVSKINRLRKNKTVPGIHLIKKLTFGMALFSTSPVLLWNLRTDTINFFSDTNTYLGNLI